CIILCISVSFYFLTDTATTEIYTLSLHDALPICNWRQRSGGAVAPPADLGAHPCQLTGTSCRRRSRCSRAGPLSHCRSAWSPARSEEHTSELQSRGHLVCRLLLEKKKKKKKKKKK